jgi:hypothetical protein
LEIYEKKEPESIEFPSTLNPETGFYYKMPMENYKNPLEIHEKKEPKSIEITSALKNIRRV